MTATKPGTRSRSRTARFTTWSAESTYIQEPPFFVGYVGCKPEPLSDVRGARVLALFGDSVTTDHISPAGSIALNSPAAKYLMSLGVEPKDFNTYGTRRGNDRVMVRGTFANIRLKNQLVPGVEGGVTVHLPERRADVDLRRGGTLPAEGTPLIVIAGKEYGTGSSRDWAAKGCSIVGRARRHRGELTSVFTAAIWWAWACCRCSLRRATVLHRWD